MSEPTPTTTTTTPPALAASEAPAPAAAATAAPTTTSSSDNVKAPATTQKKETAQPSTVESVVASVKRYIPGLNREPSETASTTAASKKRNRPKKAAATAAATTDKDIKGASDPALATATLETAPDKSELPDSLTVGGGAGGAAGAKARPAALNGGANDLSQDELAALEQKRFSPAALVQKRLKVNNKKLVRSGRVFGTECACGRASELPGPDGCPQFPTFTATHQRIRGSDRGTQCGSEEGCRRQTRSRVGPEGALRAYKGVRGGSLGLCGDTAATPESRGESSPTRRRNGL